MDTLLRSVFITFDFVGFHRWPDAPEDVDYLRVRHRHLFKTRVEIAVDGDNRSIEYHQFKRALLGQMATHSGDSYLHNRGEAADFGHEFELINNSCEAIAEWILNLVRLIHADAAWYEVQVSEDGENGSVVMVVPSNE